MVISAVFACINCFCQVGLLEEAFIDGNSGRWFSGDILKWLQLSLYWYTEYQIICIFQLVSIIITYIALMVKFAFAVGSAQVVQQLKAEDCPCLNGTVLEHVISSP